MARVTLEKNVKFKGLVKRLNLPKPYVRGLLETMWDVAHECGNPVLGSAEDVELAAEWPGEPGLFFEAIREKWIDQREDGKWIIHDYFEHAPDYVRKRRDREMERKNKELQRNSADNGGQNGTTAENIRPPTRAPAPTLKDKNLSTDSSTVPPDAAAVATQPIVMTFPTVKGRREGSIEWHLRQDHLRELECTFDGLNVLAECRRALGWINADRTRRKTGDGMKRFLYGWMSRTQNRGGGHRISGSDAPPRPISKPLTGVRKDADC